MQDAKLSRREREAQGLYRSWLRANGAVDKSDRNLYAIAQLAAFKLKAQRAVISLVDADTQYVLAEATQDLCPSHDATSVQDQLLLGISNLPRSEAFCDHSIFHDSASRHGNVDADECDRFVCTDCTQDGRFKDHVLVKEQGVRSTAGVPLVSRNTGTIGTLVVLDDSPREDLNDGDWEALQEYAKCVVRHLELVRSTVDPSREVRVLRGIAGSFADQYPALSGESLQGYGKDSQDDDPDDASTTNNEHDPSYDTTNYPRSMETSLLAAFKGVAKILRQCSFADGAVIFGARQVSSLIATGGNINSDDADEKDAGAGSSTLLGSSLREGVTCPAVQNQQTPSVRSLKRLASIYPHGMAFDVTGRNVKSRDDRSGPNPSHTALAMNQDAVAIEEEGGDLAALHEEVLDTIGEAQTMVSLPVYDQEDGSLLASCFFWDSSALRMANGNNDIMEYRALGNFLSHSVAQVRMQSKDAEQSKFISNFSHELRSPIHGILGSAQFLQDTVSGDHQNSLLQSIVVSSNTLLDTLNVVLDYTKYEHAAAEVKRPRLKEGPSSASPAPIQPFYVQADIDLALLIEDATETVVAGHFFDNLPGNADQDDSSSRHHDSYRSNQGVDRGTTQDVKVILQLSARQSWSVVTSPGAVSRIVMNVVGNALKFTQTGNIKVALEPKDDADASKVHVRLSIEDTGIGMSDHFRKNHLFAPHRQANPYSPGVGLGMSVLKHMVQSLNGQLSVSSKQHEGTLIDVDLTFEASKNPDDGIPADLANDLDRIKGKHLVLLDLNQMYEGHQVSDSVMNREQALRSVATNWLGMRVSTTSDINVPDADFYLFSEPPPVDDILEHHEKAAKEQSSNLEIPLIIVTTDSREAHMINRNHAVSLEKTGRIVQVLSQPCGPRKLAKVLNLCQDRKEQSQKDRAKKNAGDPSPEEHKPSEAELQTQRDQYGNVEDGEDLQQINGPPSISAKRPSQQKVSKSSPQGQAGERGDPIDDSDSNEDKDQGEQKDYQFPDSEDPKPPFAKPLVLSRSPAEVASAEGGSSEKASLHGLCVDDNKINLRLLVTLMRKEKHTHEQAENGQEALDAFKAGSGTEPSSDDSRRPFDFICMDIGMPVMNGIQATKAIREHERQNNLPATYIVACTAWGDAQTQQEAEAAGVDAFLPKPLKFANLKDLLNKLQK